MVSLAFCSLILCSDISKIKVYADGEQRQISSLPVELTSAQTLALYGSSIPAWYYDGASARQTTFEFYKSSKSIATEVKRAFSDGFVSVTEPSNMFGFCWNTFIEDWWISENVPAVNRGSWLVDSNGYIKAEAITPYEFLIYRAPIALNNVNQLDYDFQISLDFSVSLDGVERFCTINAYSIGNGSGFANNVSVLPYVSCSNLRSTMSLYSSSSSTNALDVTSDCYRNLINNDYFGSAFHPINIADLSNASDNYYNFWSDNSLLFPSPVFSMCYFDSGDLSSATSLTSMTWDIFAASGVVLKEDNWTSANENDREQAYTYLMLMCPVVWGDVSQPSPSPENPDYSEGINNIVSGVGITNTKLDLILQKLDQIYQTEININTNISSIGTKIDNISTSILTGLQNLFIPSQTDLINFRLNMQSDFQNHFPAFFTADDKVHNLYSVFQGSVSARSQIHVPLIQLSCPDVANNRTASFEFGGYDVDLKPNADKIGILYDSLAIIIDIIATLGILNMLRSRFRKIIGGGDIE